MSSTLESIRSEIDAIDMRIVELFVRRLSLMGRVAEAKKASGVALTDAVREREVLERLSALAPGEGDAIRALYQTIFAISKERQKRSAK